MKKIIYATLLILGAVSTSTALAANDTQSAVALTPATIATTSTMPAKAKKDTGHPKGWYVGLGLGYAAADMGNSWLNSFVTNSGFAASFNGGYNFEIAKPFYLGLEAEYGYWGPFEDANVGSVNLYATATAYLSKNFSLFGKVGMATEVLSIDNISGSTDIAPIVAVGAAYDITKNWQVNGQYQHVFGDSLENITSSFNSNSALTYNVFLFGARYNF